MRALALPFPPVEIPGTRKARRDSSTVFPRELCALVTLTPTPSVVKSFLRKVLVSGYLAKSFGTIKGHGEVGVSATVLLMGEYQ